MKPIRFTPHAEGNLAAREVARVDVEDTIRQPDHRKPARPPREVVGRLYEDKLLGQTMLLRVLIEETDEEIAVVTFYKTSKLKKYLSERPA